MPIPELPAELWHQVCALCTNRKDLANLRLVSRALSAVADEWFLRDVPLFFAKDDFDTTETIVENPRVANGIRRLHFQADRLPAVPSYESWKALRKQQIKHDIDQNETLFSDTEAEQLMLTDRGTRQWERAYKREEWLEAAKDTPRSLAAGHQSFLNLLAQQRELFLQDRARLCLYRLFMTCPKLENITLRMRDASGGLDWRSCKAFCAGMVQPYGDPWSFQIGCKPLDDILLAAIAAQRNLESLDVAPISYQFFQQDETTMSTIYSIINGLKSLKLTINREFQDDKPAPPEDDDELAEWEDEYGYERRSDAAIRVVDAFRHGGLKRFLSKATSLRDLFFRGPVFSEIELPLDYAIDRGAHWQHLASLSLYSLQCSPSALGALLLRHQHTLNTLVMGDISFSISSDDPLSWENCFETFAGKMPKVQEVCLDGRFLKYEGEFGPDRHVYFFDHSFCRKNADPAPCEQCLPQYKLKEYIRHGGAFPSLPDEVSYDFADDEGSETEGSDFV